jgi:hypothetical protein
LALLESTQTGKQAPPAGRTGVVGEAT